MFFFFGCIQWWCLVLYVLVVQCQYCIECDYCQIDVGQYLVIVVQCDVQMCVCGQCIDYWYQCECGCIQVQLLCLYYLFWLDEGGQQCVVLGVEEYVGFGIGVFGDLQWQQVVVLEVCCEGDWQVGYGVDV